MMKIVKLERQTLLDFVDLEQLADFLRHLPEVRKEIAKVSRATRKNYSDGIAELCFEADGRVRVGFEIHSARKGDLR